MFAKLNIKSWIKKYNITICDDSAGHRQVLFIAIVYVIQIIEIFR